MPLVMFQKFVGQADGTLCRNCIRVQITRPRLHQAYFVTGKTDPSAKRLNLKLEKFLVLRQLIVDLLTTHAAFWEDVNQQ